MSGVTGLTALQPQRSGSANHAPPDFRAVFQALPGCYLVLSADGQFTVLAASNGWLSAVTTGGEEVIGRRLFEIFPEDLAMDRGLRASFHQVLRSGTPDVMPVWKSLIGSADTGGTPPEARYWAVTNTPVLDAANMVAFIIHRIEDVTAGRELSERLQGENERLDRQVTAERITLADANRQVSIETDARQRSEERFAAAFRLAPVPMVVSLLDGFRILDVNEAFAATFGYSSTDAVGHTADELKLWDQSIARQRAQQALLATGRLRSFDARLTTKTGWQLDCLISAEIVTIDERRCALAVLQDITERKRSEAELAAAIETVLRDTSWFSQTIIEKLAQLRHPERVQEGASTLADLTPRERDVLGLLCQGLTGDTIAAKLGLSRNTVRNHLAGLYGKLGVNGRSDAIIWARNRGFSGAPA